MGSPSSTGERGTGTGTSIPESLGSILQGWMPPVTPRLSAGLDSVRLGGPSGGARPDGGRAPQHLQARLRPVPARAGKGDSFSRQHLGKGPQPQPAGVGAPGAGAGLSPLTKPPPKGAVPPRRCGVGAEQAPGGCGEAAEGTGGDGGGCRCLCRAERAGGARLCPGPGFRACGFSRLTGGQWAGARAGAGPAGVSDHPEVRRRLSWAGRTRASPEASPRARGTLKAAGAAIPAAAGP